MTWGSPLTMLEASTMGWRALCLCRGGLAVDDAEAVVDPGARGRGISRHWRGLLGGRRAGEWGGARDLPAAPAEHVKGFSVAVGLGGY